MNATRFFIGKVSKALVGTNDRRKMSLSVEICLIDDIIYGNTRGELDIKKY